MQVFAKHIPFYKSQVIGFALILLLATCALPAHSLDMCAGHGVAAAQLYAQP